VVCVVAHSRVFLCTWVDEFASYHSAERFFFRQFSCLQTFVPHSTFFFSSNPVPRRTNAFLPMLSFLLFSPLDPLTMRCPVVPIYISPTLFCHPSSPLSTSHNVFFFTPHRPFRFPCFPTICRERFFAIAGDHFCLFPRVFYFSELLAGISPKFFCFF